MRPLVLITGTSSGIGLSAAIACAEAGFEVIATMRDLERRHALDVALRGRGLDTDDDRARGVPAVHVEQLDVDAPTVGDKVRELLLKYGPIEALVNNAGIAVGGAFEEQSPRDVRDQFETNVFGAMEVTRAMLPSMRANRRGRIVNVSSISGRIGFPCLAVYAASKHAVVGWSDGLRHELRDFGIEVCVIEPGTYKTAIYFGNQRRGALVDEAGAYAELSKVMERLFLGGAEAAPGPDAVGRRIALLLREPSPPFRTVIGSQARALSALRRVVPDALFSSGMRRIMGL